jgi:hypothetical protein
VVLDAEEGSVVLDNVPFDLVQRELGREPAQVTHRVLRGRQHFTYDARSRVRTALLREPCTVERRTKTEVERNGSVSTSAYVCLIAELSYALRMPCAAGPRASTTRSGVRSWSSRWVFSRVISSSSRNGPLVCPFETVHLRSRQLQGR